MLITVEAASNLEKVSEECKKTEDVDIDGMLTNTTQCIQCLNELADVETNKTRLVCKYCLYKSIPVCLMLPSVSTIGQLIFKDMKV